MSRLPEASPMPTSVPVHDVDAWPSPGRSVLAVVTVLALWLVGSVLSTAHAGNISWSIGVNVPISGYGHGQGHGAVYSQPGAVYVAPGYPAVVHPQPVYRRPAQPVVIYGSNVHVYPTPHAAPTVVYTPPPHIHHQPPGRPHWERHHRGHRGDWREERWHGGGRWERY